jgi:hypothetical protein
VCRLWFQNAVSESLGVSDHSAWWSAGSVDVCHPLTRLSDSFYIASDAILGKMGHSDEGLSSISLWSSSSASSASSPSKVGYRQCHPLIDTFLPRTDFLRTFPGCNLNIAICYTSIASFQNPGLPPSNAVLPIQLSETQRNSSTSASRRHHHTQRRHMTFLPSIYRFQNRSHQNMI